MTFLLLPFPHNLYNFRIIHTSQPDKRQTMDLKTELHEEIERLTREHPANRFSEGQAYFDTPLVGFASATDPLFDGYKDIIGPFHWAPTEILGRDEGTVVSWILPITERTRVSNRKQDRYPSLEWGRTRNFGERFNDELRKAVVRFLISRGCHAVAPMLADGWARVDDPRIGLASTWSERHAAYAAGLGTFSLNDGLITPRGIAHRCGSVITDFVMEPSARPYRDYRENCLTCRGLECGVCIQRCPVGAISLDGHDKHLCQRYTSGPGFQALKEEYGVSELGCGLCQTDVPCEDAIPEG